MGDPVIGGETSDAGGITRNTKKLPLQKGWESKIDSKTGRTYYLNRKLKKTQWKRPVETNEAIVNSIVTDMVENSPVEPDPLSSSQKLQMLQTDNNSLRKENDSL